MISTDGLTWEQMSFMGWNYNWNIQAYIGEIPEKDTCFPLAYNIYRDYEYYASTTDTQYIDFLTEISSHAYRITALYNDGESDPSNETIYWVGVDKIDISKLSVSPNPASSAVNIQTVPGISKIQILDIMGKLKDTFEITTSTTQFTIDVSNYISGVYLVRFIGDNSSFEKKLVIQ